MPFFGLVLLLAGIVLFVLTNIHAPEKAVTGGRWVYKPEFYYLFVITSLCFTLYGIYEIAAELAGKRQERKKGAGLLAIRIKKCPRCAEFIKYEAKICRYCQHEFSDEEMMQLQEEGEKLPEYAEYTTKKIFDSGLWGEVLTPGAQLCEVCGHPVSSPGPDSVGASGSAPVSVRQSQKSSRFNTPAVIATGLLGAIFLGAGFYAWQTMRQVPSSPLGSKRQGEVQQSDSTRVGLLPADKSSGSPKSAAPSVQGSPAPFKVGSEWAIDWQSKYHYRGILRIKGQLAPNQYISRITVNFTNNRKIRKTVSMDGLVTIHSKEVVINCRNPSVSWWDTDDFYLELDHNTMTGYNVDIKGRRGEAVFTLVDRAQETL